MKCIYCGFDSLYKERIGGKCPHCERPYAFEPKTASGDPTDLWFKQALDRVSGNGAVRFTPEHLSYELARANRRKYGASTLAGCLIVPLVFIGAIVAFIVGPWVLLLIVAALIALPFYVHNHRKVAALQEDQIGSWLEKWKAAHGLPAGLIQPQAALPTAESLEAMRTELEQYSFDRAVICDRRETVDLLLANNFHFENNCAVLSIDGYPASVFDLVLGMLKRNPKLHIFALHDATLAGCSMAHRLATDPAWFVGQGPIFDVGLRPVHAKAFEGQWKEAKEDAQATTCPPGVTDEEFQWLRRYNLSLAAVRPEQVIKRLFRAISERKVDATDLDHRDSTALATSFADSERVARMDAVIFSSEASASDGGGDSFG